MRGEFRQIADDVPGSEGPVIDRDGKLCGIASRVDIAVAILSTWEKGN